MIAPTVHIAVRDDLTQQVSGLQLTTAEREVVSWLVYVQATRSDGWLEGVLPPSASRASIAKHLKPAELKFALLGLAAYGLVAEHPRHPDAFYLTEAGVEYACLTDLARFCDRHLIGDADGPFFLFDQVQDFASTDPAENARIQVQVDTAMAQVMKEFEAKFLRWGAMNWVAPNFSAT